MNAELESLFRDATSAGYSLGFRCNKAHLGHKERRGVVIWLDDATATPDNLSIDDFVSIGSIEDVRKFLGLKSK